MLDKIGQKWPVEVLDQVGRGLIRLSPPPRRHRRTHLDSHVAEEQVINLNPPVEEPPSHPDADNDMVDSATVVGYR